MFIQNRAKSIAQRLNAKNIAPLRTKIAKFMDKIAESGVEIAIGDVICVDLLDSANSQNLDKNNLARSANLETRPLRGAKNRKQGCRSATADFLLEAEKRGSPPKSEKRSFWETHLNVVGGSGNRGVQPFCKKESSKISGERGAESSAESQGGWLLRNARKSFGLPRRFCEYARNDEFLDSSVVALPQNDKIKKTQNNKIKAENDKVNDFAESISELLHALKPWRKGPFKIFGTHIQSEWDSAIKFNIIAPHLNVKGKVVADIGCNNGYYMFRLLPLRPSKIVGFEPSAHCKMQFDLINAFVKSEICFEMLGVEDLAQYDCKFDCILCLGVIYHRTNPLDCLKILKSALNPRGELIIDTLIIEGEDEIVLSPLSYAKMKNVYFIPSISAFQNWLKRAGFKEIELLEIRKTTNIEQRKTAWSGGESLEDFLDKNDKNKTIEGYNAPTRAYFKAKI